MVVLDTDHVSLLQTGDDPSAQRSLERVVALAPAEVVTTIITYEEHMRGWMSYLGRAKTMAQQVTAYGKLQRHVSYFGSIPILPTRRRMSQAHGRPHRQTL
jgi:tRNA(fMet)-specific endonuclease VapC